MNTPQNSQFGQFTTAQKDLGHLCPFHDLFVTPTAQEDLFEFSHLYENVKETMASKKQNFQRLILVQYWQYCKRDNNKIVEH